MSSEKIKLYDLLEHLEKRKAMYLGNEYTFHSFDAFMNGFSISADNSQYKSELYNNFSDFNIWLLGHLPEHFGHSGGWHWQISNRNPNDDEKAFEEFFKFLEIFKKAKRKVEKITIDKFDFEKAEFDTRTKIEISKREVVNSLNKITFEHSTTIWIEGFDNEKMTYDCWCVTEKEFENIMKNLNKIKLIDIKN